MEKCRNCGADLPEGASFCPHCAQSQIERQEVKPPRLWRKKALIAALCALVLVTAALAGSCLTARKPMRAARPSLIPIRTERMSCLSALL